MNIPYFASRNHSSRFSRAASNGRGGVVCATTTRTRQGRRERAKGRTPHSRRPRCLLPSAFCLVISSPSEIARVDHILLLFGRAETLQRDLYGLGSGRHSSDAEDVAAAA